MFIALTLALWLGLYALRTYVPSAVWNLADELPLGYKPIFAVATHVLGLLGIIVVRRLQQRALTVLVVALAIVTVARQTFIAVDSIGPWFSLLGWIIWLWFMMALADEVAAHDEERQIAPALGCAIALQLGMQAAWHGLDLQSVRGPIAILCSVLLALVLCAAVMRLPRIPMRRPNASIAWMLLGVALFIEATLIGNAGRFSQITGWPLPIAVGALQIAILAGLIVAAKATAFWVRVLLIVVGFIAVFGATGFSAWAALPSLTIQIVTICGLREAADRRLRVRADAQFLIGALMFFVLIFGFYNSYELTPLWILAFAVLAIAAALAQRDGAWPQRNNLIALVPGFVLTLLYFIPPPPALEPKGEDLTVMSYNIHHGFNDDGVPGMQSTARAIARLNPDIVGFQEIGRGWTLLGGNDLVAYLKWRFPDYSMYFAPTNGQLWGNAIMSRLPLVNTYAVVFDAQPGSFRYGYVHGQIEFGDTIDFNSVHLTADLAGPSGDARVMQANDVLHHAIDVRRRGGRVLVTGDFNAHPGDGPIAIMRTSLTDLTAEAGLASNATYPAARSNERIDYIFGNGFDVVGGVVPGITTSDHLPVIVTLRIRENTQ